MDTINSIGNAKQILREVSRVIVGKDEVMIKVLLGIVAGGHILMEDIPGVGKTTMALAFSKALGLEYNRVQFTPDVLPSDVTGYSIYDKNTGTMRYQRGAGALQSVPGGRAEPRNKPHSVRAAAGHGGGGGHG